MMMYRVCKEMKKITKIKLLTKEEIKELGRQGISVKQWCAKQGIDFDDYQKARYQAGDWPEHPDPEKRKYVPRSWDKKSVEEDE